MMRYLVASVAVVLLVSSSLAGEEPAAKPASPTRLDARVTRDFQDVDVRKVIAELAKAGSLNVIVSPKVQGTVSISLKDRRALGALEQVVARVGAQVEPQDDGILRVIPRSEIELDSDYHRFRTWRPKQKGPLAGAKDPLFRQAIDPLVRREGGHWRYVAEENALILSASKSTLRIIRTILAAVDRRQGAGK